MKMNWTSFGIGMGVGMAAGGLGVYMFLQAYEKTDDDAYAEGYSDGQEQARKFLREREEIERQRDADRVDRLVREYSAERVDDIPEEEEEDGEPEPENWKPKEVRKGMEEDFRHYVETEVGVNPREADNVDPYIVSYEEFDNENPEYDKIHLVYFPSHGILMTDEEEIVDSPARMIGDTVISFIDEASMHGAFDMKNNPLLYVRNDRWGTDYEVELRTKLQATGWIRDYLEGMDA